LEAEFFVEHISQWSKCMHDITNITLWLHVYIVRSFTNLCLILPHVIFEAIEISETPKQEQSFFQDQTHPSHILLPSLSLHLLASPTDSLGGRIKDFVEATCAIHMFHDQTFQSDCREIAVSILFLSHGRDEPQLVLEEKLVGSLPLLLEEQGLS
jgi:hypothetical protein